MSLYRYEVLGKKIRVSLNRSSSSFDDPGDDGSPRTATGTITEVKIKLVNNGEFHSTHYIEFEEQHAHDKSQWFDLEELEKTGKMLWGASSSSSRSSTLIGASGRRIKQEEHRIKQEEQRTADVNNSVSSEGRAFAPNDPLQQLGRKVQIQNYGRPINGDDTRFFLGTVEKIGMDHNADGEIQYHHYVLFDDGSNSNWCNFKNLADEGRIRWVSTTLKDVVLAKLRHLVKKRIRTRAQQFIAGTIEKVKIELGIDGTFIKQFRVAFDDGSKQWFDLAELESSGDLQLLDGEDSDLSTKKRWARGNNEVNDMSTNKRPRISQDEQYHLSSEEHPSIIETAFPDSHRSASPPSPSSDLDTRWRDATSQIVSDGACDGVMVMGSFHNSGSRQSFATPPSIPRNIDQVIKYMELLEPEKQYFERQQDNRNGKFHIGWQVRCNTLTINFLCAQIFVKQVAQAHEANFESLQRSIQCIQVLGITRRLTNGNLQMKQR